MTIHYEKLNNKNFNTYSLDHFVRHQRVSDWLCTCRGNQSEAGGRRTMRCAA